MANEKKTTDQDNISMGKHNKKPDRDANAQPVPEDASNTANYKGAVDLGTDGTKATASQQQGQGSWNAKDRDNSESKSGGSDKDGKSNIEK